MIRYYIQVRIFAIFVYMKRGSADLPLHYGTVPPWLAQRMMQLGGAIVEASIIEYGRPALLLRLSDTFWF